MLTAALILTGAGVLAAAAFYGFVAGGASGKAPDPVTVPDTTDVPDDPDWRDGTD